MYYLYVGDNVYDWGRSLYALCYRHNIPFREADEGIELSGEHGYNSMLIIAIEE